MVPLADTVCMPCSTGRRGACIHLVCMASHGRLVRAWVQQGARHRRTAPAAGWLRGRGTWRALSSLCQGSAGWGRATPVGEAGRTSRRLLASTTVVPPPATALHRPCLAAPQWHQTCWGRRSLVVDEQAAWVHAASAPAKSARRARPPVRAMAQRGAVEHAGGADTTGGAKPRGGLAAELAAAACHLEALCTPACRAGLAPQRVHSSAGQQTPAGMQAGRRKEPCA